MKHALLAVLLSLALPAAARAEFPTCGGVVMVPNPFMSDKASAEKIGIYKTSGALLPHTEHYCPMVAIECKRDLPLGGNGNPTGKCRVAFASIGLPQGEPPELSVYIDDDYKITTWTTDTITAERPTFMGGKSEIYIKLNDQKPDNIQMFRITPKSSTSGELTGEWTTEVQTVNQR
jgi:hypothetical protein